jgi:hypothetical protein
VFLRPVRFTRSLFYHIFSLEACGSKILRFIDRASKQYKCHTGGSRYPVVFETGLFAGLGWIPGPSRNDGFIVFSGWINNMEFRSIPDALLSQDWQAGEMKHDRERL